MEYQKILNLFDNTSHQPSKFRTKNWVEINDESRGTYNTNGQIKFKTTMLMHIYLLKDHITVNNTAADGAAAAPFTNCISEINNTKVHNAKDIDIVMSMI